MKLIDVKCIMILESSHDSVCLNVLGAKNPMSFFLQYMCINRKNQKDDTTSPIVLPVQWNFHDPLDFVGFYIVYPTVTISIFKDQIKE